MGFCEAPHELLLTSGCIVSEPLVGPGRAPFELFRSLVDSSEAAAKFSKLLPSLAALLPNAWKGLGKLLLRSHSAPARLWPTATQQSQDNHKTFTRQSQDNPQDNHKTNTKNYIKRIRVNETNKVIIYLEPINAKSIGFCICLVIVL